MFRLMTIAGIPVSVDLSLLLIVGLTAANLARHGWPYAAMFILVFTSAILVHELGHALVLRYYRRQPYIVIHGFGGATGPVENLEPREEALVTVMGPVAGLLFGGLFWGLRWYLGTHDPLFLVNNPLVANGISWAADLNLFLSVLNLAPVFPMDGGHLLRLGLVRWMRPPARALRVLHGVGVVGAGLLAWWSFTEDMPIFGFMMVMALMNNLRGLNGESTGAVVRTHNRHADELLEVARAAIGAGNPREAARLGHQVKAMNNLSKSQLADMWTVLGLATTELGEWDEALTYLRRAPRTAAIEAAEARCVTALGRSVGG